MDRVSLTKKGLHHHDHGGSNRAYGKTEFTMKTELFPMNHCLCLAKPLYQSIQKISSLTAVRIGKNKNSFIIQNNSPSNIALKGNLSIEPFPE